jgi:hypothetical protein
MKTIKKIAAIAGSILMGTTIMAPAFAASLSNLPAPFVSNGVFDANIIVGSLSSGAGIASDMAGAMDIAAAFAQKAVTAPVEAVEGIIPARVNATTGYIGYGDSAKAQEHVSSWMLNKSYENYELNESLSFLNNGGATLDNDGVFKVDFGALQYKVSSNSTLTSGQAISLFGKEYKITSITPNDEIVFGEIVEEKELGMPSSFEISNKATVEILDMDSVSKDLLVKVTLSNGSVAFDGMMSNSGSKSFDDFEFSLSNLRTFSSGKFSIDADWTSSLLTLNHNGNASIISSDLSNWKVKINSDSIVFASPQYNLNTQPLILNSGEELSIADYFKVKFEGFDAVNKTDINAYNILDNEHSVSLSYEDVNSTLKNVYLGSYSNEAFGVNGLTDYLVLSDSEDVFRFRAFQNDSDRYVEVFNQETTNLSEPLVTLFNSTDANITTFVANKGTYSLTWNGAELNATLTSWNEANAKYLSGLSFAKTSSEVSELTLTELGSSAIKVIYGNNSLDNELGATNTDFGSRVSFSTSQANVIVTDERVAANIWYGRETEGIEAKEAQINPVNPGMNLVDIEIEVLSKPTILVGGGLANSWTQKLSEEGLGVSTEDLIAATDKAYFELIEDAFGSSQIVLVVAGRDAKDTRIASQALASHISGRINLDLTGKLAWLDTSAEDYTEIKVI